ncbi:TetR family transcriptional regulator [Thermoactinospora rubra]|uniref:TetR family transcriptional regulator n=1 Tax=Thermoactinospora rubra TaxID=1088767 RepID=UPI000A1199F7
MREDTRTKIQQVALRLFIDKGYEATSLREIAEELGVTKAALYYHFKTKDDIVAGLAEDRVEAIAALVRWAREQPKTRRMRVELITRYAEQLAGQHHHEIMRFLERNQTSLRDHPAILRMRETMLELVGELSEPQDPLAVRLRRAMALFSLHAGEWLTQHYGASPEERRAAALEVALELVER